MSDDLSITSRIVIPARELVWSASRSSGPGGQNVNKVNTKVDLRFDLSRTTALPPDVIERLQQQLANRLDAEGRVVVVSAQGRSQAANLAMARERLAELIRAGLLPEKRRRKTRPSRATKARRVQNKRQHAEKKATRQKVQW